MSLIQSGIFTEGKFHNIMAVLSKHSNELSAVCMDRTSKVGVIEKFYKKLPFYKEGYAGVYGV